MNRVAYLKMMTEPMANSTLFGQDVAVHSGFLNVYLSVRELIMATVDAKISSNSNTQLCITGHSLGAALAQLATLDMASTYPSLNINTVAFGSPRVGNTAFSNSMLSLPNVNSLVLVANTTDMVPNVPLAVQPTLTPPYTPLEYTHPDSAMHYFTHNYGSWMGNHMMGAYIDYLNK